MSGSPAGSTAPLVSIICPVYNHAAYIRQCVDSVLAQTHRNWELLVLDDGSTDASGAIVAEYRDIRIRYTRRPHAGMAGLQTLYNDGLRQARGEFIAILEGDDFSSPNRLSELLQPLVAGDAVLAYGVTALTDSHGVPSGPTIPTQGTRDTVGIETLSNRPIGSAVKAMLIADELWPSASSVVMRTSALHAIGGFQAAVGGFIVDRPTIFSLGMAGPFVYVPNVNGYWRRHPTNTTKNHSAWKDMALGQHAFLVEFLAKHRQALGLSAREERQVLDSWLASATGAALMHGRSLVGDSRQRRTARDEFAFALRTSPGWRHRIAAVLGYIDAGTGGIATRVARTRRSHESSGS